MSRYTSARRVVFTVVGAVLGLLAAACSSGSVGSAGGDVPGLSAADLASLQSVVDRAGEVPQFVAPGPAFDIAKARGKSVFVIPVASQVDACDQTAKDVAALADKVGMSATYYHSDGTPSAWASGMQRAISQQYDAIVLVCGIDPDVIGPQVRAATAAGIAVIDSGLPAASDGGRTSPSLTARTNIPNAGSIRESVDVAILDHQGKPFHALEITANDVPSSVVMDRAVRDEFTKYCPACRLDSVDIPVSDWATKVQSVVGSAIADPGVQAVVPIFDGMAQPAIAALKSSSRTDVKLYGCYGATPDYVLEMAPDVPISSDVGPAHLWRAYAAMDQTLRVLSGVPPLPPDKETEPSRLWTLANHQQAAEVNDGFGDAFPAGYEKLWGLTKK